MMPNTLFHRNMPVYREMVELSVLTVIEVRRSKSMHLQ
jgi:hypothetical protein